MGQEGVGEDPPLAVPGLPPGVGEVDMDPLEAGVREEIAHEHVPVTGDDPGVFRPRAGQSPRRHPGVA